MPVTTSSAATVAATNAAITAAMANQRRIECRDMIAQLDGQKLSVEQKQEYAECIMLIYPRPMSDGEILAIKTIIIIAVVGFCVGASIGFKEDGAFNFLVYGIVSALLFALTASCIMGLAYAVYWVFAG